MIGCGSRTFTDPGDFGLGVADARIGLVLTSCGQFNARVSWVGLRNLGLWWIEEVLARIAFIALAAELIFVSFPLSGSSSPRWCGLRARRGDLVVHAPGDRFHHTTDGAMRWGMISISRAAFASYSKVLLGRQLATPSATLLVRPRAANMSALLRLHVQACRLASSKPAMLQHREVARALEQDLIGALVTALADGSAQERSRTHERHAEIMVRYEKVLATQGVPPPTMCELSAMVGVPQRTLRICCEEFLGRSPTDYARLRRLNLARSALSKSDHETASIASIARSYGFAEPGRFAGAYRALFGETPSATLLRSSAESA